MARTALICITAILGLGCLTIFLFMRTRERNGTTPPLPRFGTIQLDTAELGAISAWQNGIVAGNAKGELRLFPSCSSNAKLIRLALSKSPISAPVLEHDNVFYVGDEDGVFSAANLKTGVLWTYKTDNRIAGGALWANSAVLVGSYDQKLYAFDPHTGHLRYAVECDGFINGSPVLSKSGDAVFFGSCDGKLRKIAVATGTIVGVLDLGAPIPASPAVCDGMLYAVTHEGTLAAIKTESFVQQYQVELPSSYTTSPWLIGDRLVLTDTDGHVVIHERNTGKFLSTLEDAEKMTPVCAGNASGLYGLSTRGKLYHYQASTTGWNRSLLHDFQTDCQSGCLLFGTVLVFADDSGGLYYYEVGP